MSETKQQNNKDTSDVLQFKYLMFTFECLLQVHFG